MSAAAVPVWRRRGDIMFLQRRIMMLENDLNGAIASAETIRSDRQRLAELQSDQTQQPPAPNPPPNQQAPAVQGETQLPNVEDNTGTREEVEPVAVIQEPQIEVIDIEDPVDALQQTQPLSQVPRAIQTLQTLNEDSEAAEQVRDLLTTIENNQLNTIIPTPPTLIQTLEEYQKQGFNWMVKMENKEVRSGGLLADGMGLWKTIQAISTILAHGTMNWNCATTLIIVPKSLFNQWKSMIIRDVKLGRRFGPLQQKFTFRRFYKEAVDLLSAVSPATLWSPLHMVFSHIS